MFRDTISPADKELVFFTRDLVARRIVPQAMTYDTHGNEFFDSSALEVLAEHNLLAPNLPPEYGGRGLSNLVTAMILEEIAAGCAGVAIAVAANLHAISPLMVAGTQEQRDRYLPLMANGKTGLGAIAMVDTGVNLDFLLQTERVSIRGSSIKGEVNEANQTVVNGSKDYVMNAAAAKFMTTMVEYKSSGSSEPGGLQIIVLPMDTPGLSLGNTRHKLGLRYCSTAEVHFNDLIAEPHHMIGTPAQGLEIFKECLYRNVPFVGAVCVGVARAAYQHALEISKERMISEHPVFEESAVSHSLVNMASQLNAARLSVHQACWNIDQGLDYTLTSPQAKIIASEAAQNITWRAMEIVGGQAYVSGNKAEKYLRDAKMLSIVDGSEQFHRCLLASQL